MGKTSHSKTPSHDHTSRNGVAREHAASTMPGSQVARSRPHDRTSPSEPSATLSTGGMEPRRAALYVRSEPDAADVEIREQLKVLERYCARREFEVIAQYTDQKRSGLDPTRPALHALLTAVRRRLFGEVVVLSPSSLTRDSDLMGDILKLLDTCRTNLVFAHPAYASADAIGDRMLKRFSEAMDRDDRASGTNAGIRKVKRS